MRDKLEERVQQQGVISSNVRLSCTQKPIAFMSFKDKEAAEEVLKELQTGSLQDPLDNNTKVFANLRTTHPRTAKSYLNLSNLKSDVTLDTIMTVIIELMPPPRNPDKSKVDPIYKVRHYHHAPHRSSSNPSGTECMATSSTPRSALSSSRTMDSHAYSKEHYRVHCPSRSSSIMNCPSLLTSSSPNANDPSGHPCSSAPFLDERPYPS